MKLEQHFLPNDISEASKEYWCALDLLCMTMANLEEGNIEKAKSLSVDLLNSLHGLTNMSEKKIQTDKMKYFAQHLNSSGIHIELVRRQLLDK
ncbi:hypothetical protein [Oceanobacillus sp. CF4.6]|uniref:hypothetical protein n=1 Tax=Oceanobacillus sp. CF4.6 TaxID=3373080 RepID=UPI003EE81064